MAFIFGNRGNEMPPAPAGGFFHSGKGSKAHYYTNFMREVSEDVYAYCYYLGVKPHWQQKELFDAYMEGDPRIACRSGQGPGKCGCASNSVPTTYGIYTLGELVGRDDIEVWAMDVETETMHTAKASCFESGRKQCVKVKADAGQILEYSTDHPIYTQRGWVQAAELTTKDLMAMPRQLPWAGTDVGCPEEVRFVGYMLGDGCFTDTSWHPSFTHLPEASLDDFLFCCDRLDIGYTEKKQRSKAKTFAMCDEAEIVIRRWTTRSLSKHKRLPDRFWSLRKDLAAQMITALWICDGYFQKDGLEICLASEGLIDDLQTALLFWGIHSRKRYKQAKCEGKQFDAWRLSISGQESLFRFVEAFMEPFVDQFDRFEKGMEKYLLPIFEKEENTNTDVVPYNDVIMKEVAEELGVSATYLRNLGFRGRDYAWLSRDKFKKMVEVTGYNGRYAKWASNDIYWVRVVSVEDIGEHPVYDLCVPEYGNFVSENLVVHNTWASAVVGTHWNMTHDDSRLIVTAPTMKQCKTAWLGQARDLIQNNNNADPRIRAAFSFMGTGYRLFKEKPEDWGCILMTATNEEAAQGQHKKYLGLICEEASGIPRGLITQFKGTLSNMEGNYIHLMIGNPNTRQCAFFDCFNSMAHMWTCLHWDAEETPESEHFSYRRNEEVADEFGKDSDVYRVRVKGEFPHTDSSVLINEEDLLACTTEEARSRAMKAQAKGRIRRQIGIDLARYGGDENAIAVFSGNIQLRQEFYSRTDPNATIDRAIMIQDELNWPSNSCMFVIDTSGMGEMAAAMVGSQRRMNRQMHEFYSQNTAHESEKYANKISEAWCLFAKAVRKQEIYLIYDKLTFAQLSNRLYSVDKHGRILIETKDQYKKRNEDTSESGLAKSPDRADAMVMAAYEHATMSTRAAFA